MAASFPLRIATLALVCAIAPACAAGQSKDSTKAAQPLRHVIVVSVDGLRPETYTNPDGLGLKVPTLRKLVAEGAWSPGAQSVFPTVTYPTHTTLATGTNPGTHGIFTNFAWDPLGENQEGWRWYAEDIRVPTLWDVAREKGLRTALLMWPATVGARATALIPEYWRAGNPEDTKLIRSISTPGLTEAVMRRFPDFWKGFNPPRVEDVSTTSAAVHVIETQRPHLLMVHIFDVDHWQHERGMGSAEAIAAIENADAQIARIIAAAKKSGMWRSTALVIVSDHGFAPVEMRVRPGVLLRDNDLVTLDSRNRITDWKAVVLAGAGHAYIYVKDAADEATRKKLEEVFASRAGQPGSGIGKVYRPAEIREMGGDPEAFLALEGAQGFGIASGYWGEYISPATVAATHGFDPRRPDMQASLLVRGPGVVPGKIEGARLLDVAPTVARWLGLKLSRAEGRPLNLPAHRAAARTGLSVPHR